MRCPQMHARTWRTQPCMYSSMASSESSSVRSVEARVFVHLTARTRTRAAHASFQASERYAHMESSLQGELDQLKERFHAADTELKVLREFKIQKRAIEDSIVREKRDRARLESNHRETLAALERQVCVEKDRLQRAHAQMAVELKRTLEVAAVERLNASTKRILLDNQRMLQALKLHSTRTTELNHSNGQLSDEKRRLKMQLELSEQAVGEHAKQGIRRAQINKELNTQVIQLEKELAISNSQLEKVKQQLSQLGSQTKSDGVRGADAATLCRLLKLKAKEATQAKRTVAITLQKKNRIETFLLDAIEHVQNELRHRQPGGPATRTGARGVGKWQPMLGAPLPPSKLPQTADECVDVRDLSWEDRERVLRLLFAKINEEPLRATPPTQARDPMRLRKAVARALDSETAIETNSPAFFVTQLGDD